MTPTSVGQEEGTGVGRWAGPVMLPGSRPTWRAPETLVVVGVWLLLMTQQLAVSLSRPKMYVPLTDGGQDVPAWAATVTTVTNAGILALALAVVGWQLRRAPWRRWTVLALVLVPWVVVVARLVMLERPPSAIALVFPAIAVALWFARPRLAVVEVLGHLTVATAAISVLLGILAPGAGLYERAAGAELEKPIGPFGVLAGPMLSGNDLGLVLVVGIAAVWTIRRTVVRWVGTGLVVVAIVWSASRTALGALAAVVVVALVLRGVRVWSARSAGEPAGRLAPRLAAAVLVGLAVVVVALPLVVHADAALNNRGRLWAFAAEGFRESPALGKGADVFKVLASEEANLGGHASHAHNLLAHVLVTGGAVLVVTVVVLVAVAGRRAVQQVALGWDWAVLFLTAFLVVAALEVPLVLTDRIRQYPFVAVPLLLILFVQPVATSLRNSSSSAAV